MMYSKDFESWDEFVSYLRTAPALWPASACESQTGTNAEFFGSASWDEAMRYAVTGHAAGRAAIESAAVKFTSAALPDWDTAPVGAFPCIPAYAAGAPEDMFTMSELAPPTQSPIVRIVVNMTASAMITQEEIINRGAAIVTLIDRVQASGRRVELIAVDHSTDDGNEFAFSVTVKRPEEPVDMDRIGLVFATAIFLRRFMFRMIECVSPYPVPGYGDAAHIERLFQPGDLVIGKIKRDECITQEKARESIEAAWARAAA